MFLFCRPFVVITTFSTGLVGVEVSRAFKNVVLTMKVLQERNTQLFGLDDGGKIGKIN